MADEIFEPIKNHVPSVVIASLRAQLGSQTAIGPSNCSYALRKQPSAPL